MRVALELLIDKDLLWSIVINCFVWPTEVYFQGIFQVNVPGEYGGPCVPPPIVSCPATRVPFVESTIAVIDTGAEDAGWSKLLFWYVK